MSFRKSVQLHAEVPPFAGVILEALGSHYLKQQSTIGLSDGAYAGMASTAFLVEAIKGSPHINCLSANTLAWRLHVETSARLNA